MYGAFVGESRVLRGVWGLCGRKHGVERCMGPLWEKAGG